jgi:predicted O-methyltransferase YrrM
MLGLYSITDPSPEQSNKLVDHDIWNYSLENTKKESDTLLELKEETYKSVHGSQMLSETLVVKVLQFFIRLQKPKICIDLGTYTGFSALAMAEVLEEDSMVYTLDKKGQSGHETAKKHIEKSIHQKKVKFLIGDAKNTIQQLPDQIDFAFIDADKKQTVFYFDFLLARLVQGGIIIVDDVLWYREVLNPQDERAKSLHKFNQYIARHPSVDNVILPIRHGLNIIYKKPL